MLFRSRRQSRRERMAMALRQLLPSRRTVALVAGAAAFGLANSRVSSAREKSR
jgi:hypothetical protein